MNRTNLKEHAQAIAYTKQTFCSLLCKELNLTCVPAPLFVAHGTGINDDLSGTERPVKFSIKDLPEHHGVVVHSLAKWKRMALARYRLTPGEGICTDMRAIRADESLDAIHSLYVDQWDWERVITDHDRALPFLKHIVRRIYRAMRTTERTLAKRYPHIIACLPKTIHFIHTQELADHYPTLTPQEREHEICKKYGAVFLIGIGGTLRDGTIHDGRAPDYDDWSTSTIHDYKGLNGDILVWTPVLNTSLELSSMGIRVDKTALARQLAIAGANNRKDLSFHTALLADKLPLSIGGGIGQSRLCMFMLRATHIGHVHCSLWNDDTASNVL